MAKKLDACSTALNRWKQESFGEVHQSIRRLAEALKGEKDIHKRRTILNEISMWRRKEEVFWAQRAKVDFLKHGDSNSKWFHARAKVRYSTNYIQGLQQDDGTWVENEAEVRRLVVDYFEQLFSTTHPERFERILETIPVRVTDAMNDGLMREYSEAEILAALNSMGPTKSPGRTVSTPAFISITGLLWEKT